MKRSKAERRHNDWVKIHKKENIIKNVWKDDFWFEHTFKGKEHMLSKAKIHCSCPMCSQKTNNKNRKGARGWEPSKNWCIKDEKRERFVSRSLRECCARGVSPNRLPIR